MRKIIIGFALMLVGFIVGFGFAYSSVYGIRHRDFYRGMMTFCTIAPTTPGSIFVNQYSASECQDMIAQAQQHNYFEQVP